VGGNDTNWLLSQNSRTPALGLVVLQAFSLRCRCPGGNGCRLEARTTMSFATETNQVIEEETSTSAMTDSVFSRAILATSLKFCCQ